MADNRQVASTLSLIAGILSIVFGLGMLLLLSFISSVFAFAPGEAFFVAGFFGAFALFVVAVHAAAAIVFLLAAPRLRADDPELRRTWGIWTIVVGAVSLLGPVGIIVAGLGIAAGALTLADLNRATA